MAEQSVASIPFCMCIVAMLVVKIIFNPNTTWWDARRMNEAPKWVKDRVKPLTEEQTQKWDAVESLGAKLFGSSY